MKLKHLRVAGLPLLTLILMVLLAACGMQPSPIPGTGDEAQTATPPVSPELTPEAVLKAQAWLAEEINLPVEEVSISTVERAEWPDSCLGLGQANESCAQVVTPGWRVVFTANGQDYEVRTDETGSVIRLATPAGTPGAGEDPLANTQWRLVSFGQPGAETPVIEGSEITLTFEADGRAGGNSGCNSYGGSYQVQDGAITFREIASTLRACEDEQVNQQEQSFLQALQAAATFDLGAEQLTIWDENRQTVLNFVPAGGAPSMPTSTPTLVAGQPTPAPERIEFGAGETSATVTGQLPVSGSDLYVLSAQGGQTMTVELSFNEGRAILAVWGEDGNVLMSDHAEASRFSGELPSTQDYFILLKGSPESATQYSMTVTIPPL